MEITQITHHKKQYLDLLLLADEQESMIDRYLGRGDMYVLREEDKTVAVCVVTKEGEGIYEIKNLATAPAYQRKGYGRRLIRFLFDRYRDRCHTWLVGTGDSPLTIPFYESCGFTYSHRIPNFFTDHYDHPILECGRQLIDMIYLKHPGFSPSEASERPTQACNEPS